VLSRWSKFIGLSVACKCRGESVLGDCDWHE